MPTRNVNLPTSSTASYWPRSRAGGGRYENASEVIRAALRTMERENTRLTLG